MLTIADTLTAQTTTFGYDDLNRLKDATIPNVYAHSWTYNSIGNMLTRNDNNGNVIYQYTNPAHKHAVSQIGSQYFCGVYPEELRECEWQHDAPQYYILWLHERRFSFL